MSEQKQRFLEHFDELDATDELDALLGHIARFTEAFVHQQSRLHEVQQAVGRAVASSASTCKNAAATA